ncbi:thioester domain-containing protein [Micromonospora krabiensis]|uniref:LPXTG-motif cell wall anchor domain-containing protein/TQXA domain-containing protein n=1 Tax=Micromonospora krabiensis TaxID=307121 RepID=A0A1C3NAT6_9ACTN|nr:thioester domain-containing protein [Micromonospora krabiensis]SBV29669.1 LPXTG-motif cell wall anchor domain-containing protein/TQXA domain-containing protein [Micromonospora krabiensis]
MFGQRGRRWARVALAAVAGGALALGVAGPAAADEPATGIAKSTGGSVKLMLNGKAQSVSGLALKIDGKLVPAFCIDYHTSVAIDGRYNEGTWSESEVKNLGKVQWVLTHGYPNADPAKLLAAAGATLPEKADAKKLLYFGTQTAVWHFSDGIELGNWANNGKDLLGQRQYEVVQKVRNYLVNSATDQPEPRAELKVDPATATATVGEKAGPFTVTGPAGDITLAVTGGTAVDVDGKAITTTTNGGTFWLTGTEAGKAEVTLSAKGSVSFGRVFLSAKGKNKHQKLILGGSTDETVTAKAGASFTAAPTTPASPTPTATASPSPSTTVSPSATPTTPGESPAPSTSPASNGGALPLTGSPIATAITIGVLLLAAGAATVLVMRRRKVRFTA